MPPARPPSDDGGDCDHIQEGAYTDQRFHRREYTSMVVADGAHMADVGVGKGLDVRKLARFLTEEEDGPQVAPREERGGLGWHWVDSEEARGHLQEGGVGAYFDPVLYPDVGGRQSTQVDAKVQSLLRSFFYKAGLRHAERHARLVLVAGDGDHAQPLWRGVELFLKGRNARSERLGLRKDAHVDVWIIGSDSTSVSQKLKACTLSSLAAQVAVHVRYLLTGGGYAQLWTVPKTVTLPPVARPLLRGFVDAVFPQYNVPGMARTQALLRNPGLHHLLEQAWHDPDRGRVFIVNGLTGSGKSTQVPQLLYDLIAYKRWVQREDGVQGARPRVICTQPRRIACTQVAARVGKEREAKDLPWDVLSHGVPLGRDGVGYHIGGVRRCTDSTPIVYCTAGVALKQLIHSRDTPWDVMLLDEAHERSKEFDLLLALLLSPDTLTGGRYLVIMSATLADMVGQFRRYCAERLARLGDGVTPWFAEEDVVQRFDITAGADAPPPPLRDAAAFAAYAAPAGTGQCFQVPVKYLDDIQQELDSPGLPKHYVEFFASVEWDAVFSHVRRNGRASPNASGPPPVIWNDREMFIKQYLWYLVQKAVDEGTKEVFLVFVPSMGMMKDIGVYMEHSVREYCRCPAARPVVKYVHGQMGQDVNHEALEATAVTRVILATNIAESSLTIEDVSVVVDLCLQKCPVRNPVGYVSDAMHKRLNFSRAPQDSCVQRTGRVGRVRKGDRCYRMISKADWNAAPRSRAPEILSCNLDDWLLNLYQRFEQTELDPKSLLLRCVTPPPAHEVEISIERLVRMRLIEPSGGGRHRLLPAGRVLHRLPIDLDLGRLVIWACLVDAELGKLAVEFAAMASTETVLVDPVLEDDDTARDKLHKYASRAWKYKMKARGYPSDVVLLLTLLRQFRKEVLQARDGDRSGVKKWCQKNCVSYTEMETVDWKVAQLRHELHRCRPLFPALPEKLWDSASRRDLATSDVVGAIRREAVDMSDENLVLLLTLHAGMCSDSSRTVSKEALPGDVQFQCEFVFHAETPGRAVAGFYRNAEQLFTSFFEDAGACRVVEGRGKDGRGRRVKVAIELSDSLGEGGQDPLDMAHQLAQIDACSKEIFADRALQWCKVSLPGCEYRGDDSTFVKAGSVLRPILARGRASVEGRLYPTSVTSHQKKEKNEQYTDQLSVVTFLPDSLASAAHPALTLAAVLDSVFKAAASLPLEEVAAQFEWGGEGAAAAQDLRRIYDDLTCQRAVNTALAAMAPPADAEGDDVWEPGAPAQSVRMHAAPAAQAALETKSLRDALLTVLTAMLDCPRQELPTRFQFCDHEAYIP